MSCIIIFKYLPTRWKLHKIDNTLNLADCTLRLMDFINTHPLTPKTESSAVTAVVKTGDIIM